MMVSGFTGGLGKVPVQQLEEWQEGRQDREEGQKP
jgi:hypothetical protein